MTVSSTFRRAGPYAGNGSQTQYPFNFKVFIKEDLRVVRTINFEDNDLVLDRDYTVVLNAEQKTNPGGKIILSSALAADAKLTIISNREYNQKTDLTNRGGFYPEVINAAFDHVVILIQQLLEESKRGLKIAVSSSSAIDTTLPVSKPGRLIGWSADGNSLIGVDPDFITAEWQSTVGDATRDFAENYLAERGFLPESNLISDVSAEVEGQLAEYGITQDDPLQSVVNTLTAAYLNSRGFADSQTLPQSVSSEVINKLAEYGITQNSSLADLTAALASQYLQQRGFGADSNLITLIQDKTLEYLNQQGIDGSELLKQLIKTQVQSEWATFNGQFKVFEITPTAKSSDLIFVKDHQCLKVWQELSGWSGYASMRLGEIVHGTTVEPRPDEIDLMGGTLSKVEYPEIWAYAVTNGLVVDSSAWTTGTLAYVDLGDSFKVPDLRDMFLRFTGTNADNANVRVLGSKQGDAIRNIAGYIYNIYNSFYVTGNTGPFLGVPGNNYVENTVMGTGGGGFSFDVSRVVPTGGDNRPMNIAVIPRQKR